MSSRPKRDASYASNRLTRGNGPGGHLLSTFNKPESPNDTESDIQPSIEKPTQSYEPAIDDAPLSSEDEEADNDSDASQGRRNDRTNTTMEQRLADDYVISQGSPQNYSGSYHKSTFVRTNGGMSDEENNPHFMSSQSSKRKRATYAKPQPLSRHSSVSKPPAASGKTSPAKSKTLKSSAKQPDNANKEPEEPEEPEVTFKMPKDLPSSSPRRSFAGRRKNGASENIPPPILPNESFSASSFGTLSSKEQQLLLQDSDSSLNSPLSSPSSSMCEEMSQLEDRQPSSAQKALCPMCKAEVDREMLKLFEAQPKQRIREQQQFCASHQERSAMREWEAKGYPEINWDTFDERLQGHFPELEKLLVPDTSCYYRNILDTSMKSGQAKNFRLTLDGDGLESITCGYYGTKGAGKMLQAVIDRFSLRLRRLATSDHIAKTAGVAGYAQSVLVPELAVRLVKEDMNVSDEAARQILRESIEIGERLNPALNDVIPIPDDVDL
ncbi:hypothetical protein N7508_004273 [Penicillium antarcticum]|uniref:uncharacterized protein n=1 Tax=Penicillium antarcticum TaxID=416450 RepID=UPI002383A7C0|nr:uncharacterized protein N7508_004273 [Penicillium antarcticum]KAJ5308894.1 hypothetical protein N7508_004273 [Penicillium antarcticum]